MKIDFIRSHVCGRGELILSSEIKQQWRTASHCLKLVLVWDWGQVEVASSWVPLPPPLHCWGWCHHPLGPPLPLGYSHLHPQNFPVDTHNYLLEHLGAPGQCNRVPTLCMYYFGEHTTNPLKEAVTERGDARAEDSPIPVLAAGSPDQAHHYHCRPLLHLQGNHSIRHSLPAHGSPHPSPSSLSLSSTSSPSLFSPSSAPSPGRMSKTSSR